MADINSVTLVGRLTRPGEIRYAQSGQAVVRFSLAVNRAKRTSDGRWEEEPNFFDCVYFGKAAESINPYLEKGRQIAVQGELRQSRWEQDGQTRTRVEIAVNNLTLGQTATGQGRTSSLGNAQPQQSFNNTRPQQSAPSYSAPPITGGPEDFSDDSIPF